jgi:chemotaxis protein histidine kinase CheA
MPDFRIEEDAGYADSVAEVRREFCEGLPNRIRLLESAVAALQGAFDSQAAEAIYFQTHSLKGTAGAFGADTLVGPAREISAIAEGWVKQGRTTSEALSEVQRELVRLTQAVTDYLKG